ncbi:hypothetical protein AC249_AIPGENE18643 [Exaiptasia diaphana]|nr:hypothetical protein AC249_AIPGENE18643 [Exaiptasia diaphana]
MEITPSKTCVGFNNPNANELKNSLQKRAFANLDKRIKRGVPSDTVTESCVQVRPSKSLSFPASTATQEITERQVLPSVSDVCRIQLLPAPITRPDDLNEQEDVPLIEEECKNIHISIKYPSGKTSNKPSPEEFHKIGKALIRNATVLEVCEKSPVTFQILQAVAVPSVSKNIAGCSKRLPGILLAVGVLLKTRHPIMSLIPHIISLTLKAAGTSKKETKNMRPSTVYLWFEGCSASSNHDGKVRRRHGLAHNPPPEIREAPKITPTTYLDKDSQACKPFKDDVFDYHRSLINMALLLRNFIDAGREGDGDRLVRWIKIFLLHFRQDGEGSVKYTLESLYHLFQLTALMSPREAERMKCNRTVNNKGGTGNNVFKDIDFEHDNHLFKELLRRLVANATKISVSRICRAFFPVKSLLETVDKATDVQPNSSAHKKKDVKKYLMIIAKILVEEVFKVKPDHRMTFFSNCPLSSSIP